MRADVPRPLRLSSVRRNAKLRRTKLTARGAHAIAWGATVLVAASLGAAASCTTGGLQRCDTIPEGGCPIGRGGTCDDKACRGLYDCAEGSWALVIACSPGHGGSGGLGAGGVAGAAGAAGGGAGGGCAGAELDHSGEMQGCAPELELPDCPALVAESCQPCLSGCADFFMCLEGGWGWVAYCTDEGQVVVVR